MILIQYWLGDRIYERRKRATVPRTGDRVRLNGVIYQVCLVVWIEDAHQAMLPQQIIDARGQTEYVNIELMPETIPMPAGACFERPREPEEPPAAPVTELPKRKRKRAQ